MKQAILITSRHIQSLFSLQSSYLLQLLIGSIFLGLMAQIAIPLPFTPVPITLQTLSVSILAMTLGSRKAPLAVMMYLFEATLGLPLLAGGVSNPLWIIGPKAGYLIGFMAAAYLTAKLLERQEHPSFMKTAGIFLINEGCILTMGFLWLSLFVGSENALYMGIAPFIPGACIKAMIATMLFKSMSWAKSII